jgi:hypothetical protein
MIARLPNADSVHIDRRKVVDYLLNAEHPDNAGKARFFAGLGFTREDPERLEQALRALAREGRLTNVRRTGHGVKYLVEGHLSPYTGGAGRLLRSIWIIDAGNDRPRLVTAYPRKETA